MIVRAQPPQASQSVFTAAQAQSGRAVYDQNCSARHGINFEGSGDAPSLAGGWVLVGDINRGVHILDVRTGQVLWETRLGTSAQGFPVTYSAGGKQYIAVMTGLGGGSPRNVPAAIAPDIKIPQSGQALYVFALP